MAPITNGRLVYNEIPTRYPVPGKTLVYDTSQTIDLETVSVDGGILVKILVVSIDPYLRGRMRDPNAKRGLPPFYVGEPIVHYGVALVLRSETASIKSGDHVYGFFPFQQYAVLKDTSGLRVLKNEEKLPWSVYLGVCGMPGQTAYYGWKEFAHPKPGDTVFVTTASGPVGSTVVQLAKAAGLKVIAAAGADEKVAFVKSIEADVSFNYKTQKMSDVLEKGGPINIYWDNVGGEALEAALDAAAPGAHFIECGMISDLGPQPHHIKNLLMIIGKQLQISGFVVSGLHSKYVEEFYREVPPMVARGEIKYLEDVTPGLENATQALVNVLTGKNMGKSVILVGEE